MDRRCRPDTRQRSGGRCSELLASASVRGLARSRMPHREAVDSLSLSILVMIAAGPSWIACRDQRLSTGWEHERRVNLGHAAGLIGGVMHYARVFKEHRTGRMDGRATIAVSFGESATLYYDHDGSRMRVPSRSSSGLKYQVSLQRVARPLHVHNDIVVGAVALCQRDDLQPG